MTRCRRDGRDGPFDRWLRSEPSLDSRSAGLAILDQDKVLHRFMRNGSRLEQFIGIVEVKTFGARLSRSQQDTLRVLNQVYGRIMIPGYDGGLIEFRPGSRIRGIRIRSLCEPGIVTLWLCGAHLLEMSHGDPLESSMSRNGWIRWDRKLVDYNTLLDLLRLEIDPNTMDRIAPTSWSSLSCGGEFSARNLKERQLILPWA